MTNVVPSIQDVFTAGNVLPGSEAPRVRGTQKLRKQTKLRCAGSTPDTSIALPVWVGNSTPGRVPLPEISSRGFIELPMTIMRQKRKSVGVTMGFMARHLGVTMKTLHKWETGATIPDRRYWKILRAAYGLYIYELYPEYFRMEPPYDR